MGERRILKSHALLLQERMAEASHNARVAAGKKRENVNLSNHLVLPDHPRRYIPLRERSLHAVVKHHAISRRRSAGRCAGFNHGKNILYLD